MIQIPRAVARTFRAICRKTASPGSPAPRPQVVVLDASRDGLVLRAQSIHVALEYDLPGTFAPEQIAIPIDALERFEGKDDSAVSLESAPDSQVIARWADAGVPQVSQFDAADPKTLLEFPSRPETWSGNSTDLLRALCDASSAADQSSTRFALDKVQLLGKSGTVVGTDGRQLFLQSGFCFPSTDDVLIPRVSFLGCREFAGDTAVEVGMTGKYVAVRISRWTIHLRIDTEGRFPQVDSIIPDPNAALATLRMSAEDAEFLARTLPRLPGHEDAAAPATIDSNGRAAVRGISNGQKPPTELVLARSECTGQAVCCAIDRKFLTRALSLGFREFRLFGPGQLTHCQDGHRQYMWMGLSEEAIVAATEDTIRIQSDEADTGTPAKRNGEKKLVSTPPAANGKSNGKTPSRPASKKAHGIAAVIDDAQSLKTVLRDAVRQSSQLVASLKRHRKQAKMMRNTIAALRQLAPLEQ